MATIAHDGVRLAYDDRGGGDHRQAPAFVFVHGWTCNRSFFAPQAAHFARAHRVVCVDLRGHGDSDKPPGPYPIALHVDDVAHVIERLELARPVVVGHSMGAMTALQLAAVHPERVQAIVMVDPAPFDPAPEIRAALEALVTAIEQGQREVHREFLGWTVGAGHFNAHLLPLVRAGIVFADGVQRDGKTSRTRARAAA
jgi:pimeloyl-ACP methyl ester carboxylesterase